MNNPHNQKIVSYEIYDIADRMLEDRIDLIEGCHKIASLHYQLDNPDRIFLFFRGIASETERFPFGRVRNTCSLEHLAELDWEKKKYLVQIRENILEACKKVIQITKE